MNYYERHLGDYARDAGHLTLLEHGAYTLLLDRYYTTEKPIPSDMVYRVCRAKTRWEKSAVDAVVTEFFEEVDGCLRHARCESEIGLARKRIEASIANGKNGGRPKNVKKTKVSKTQQVNLGSENDNLDESKTNLLQSPSIQSPSNHLKESSNPLGASAPTDAFELAWSLFPVRSGGNPKKDALQAWRARVGEGVAENDLVEGTRRYRSFCDDSDKSGTEFVMQAKRFFGPSRPYAESWVVAKPQSPKKSPAPDNFSDVDYGPGGDL